MSFYVVKSKINRECECICLINFTCQKKKREMQLVELSQKMVEQKKQSEPVSLVRFLV